MKASLSLPFFVLLLACGETSIKSVDDEVLEQAQADQAAAALKQEQTALLGTWRECIKESDAASSRYEYAFSSDGQAHLLRQDFANGNCGDVATTSEQLTATYELLPVEDSQGFTLKFKWANSKKLESQYKLSGADSAEFPKILELKEKSDLGLVELENKDHFLALKKVPADEAEQTRKKAELIFIEFANGQLKRSGSWETPCVDGKLNSLQFKVEKSITMTRKSKVYEEKDCKTVKDSETESQTAVFTLASVSDFAQRTILLNVGPAKGYLKVSFDKIDQLELSDLIGGKDSLTSYKFSATEVAP